MKKLREVPTIGKRVFFGRHEENPISLDLKRRILPDDKISATVVALHPANPVFCIVRVHHEIDGAIPRHLLPPDHGFPEDESTFYTMHYASLLEEDFTSGIDMENNWE